MAISLQDLQYLLNKQAAQAQPDAGSQAMMMAAQAARPAGAPPLPKPIDVEDGAVDSPDLDKMLKEKDSELEKAKKENEKLRHDLNESDLAHQQEIMMREIEKREKESLDKIKSEMEALNNEKTMHQAESVQHKAQLDKDTAMAQVKLEQEKAKALIDYNKQQVQEQIRQTDEARKESDRYKDEARKESDRMKDEARSYIDQYRAEVQKNLDTERSDMMKSLDDERSEFQKSKAAISPALDQLMDSTIKTIHSLPVPDGYPLQLKQAYTIQNNEDRFNVFDLYTQEDTNIEKAANSFFDDIVEGAVINVPTPSNPVFIKCAFTEGVKQFFTKSLGLEQSFINNILSGIQPTGNDDLDASIKQELNNLLKVVQDNGGINVRNPDDTKRAIEEYITGRILDGEGILYKHILPVVDSKLGTDYTQRLSGLEQKGLNMDLKNTPTKDRLCDVSTTMFGFGSAVVPKLTGEQVNDAFNTAAYNASNYVDIHDATSRITLGLANHTPTYTKDGHQYYYDRSLLLSKKDNDKLVDVWNGLSIKNRQAAGVLMSPYHRNLVGWTPYDSAQRKNNYYSSFLNNQKSSALSFPTKPTGKSQTVSQIYGGYKPATGNKYTTWQDDATGSWYSTLAAAPIYPLIKGIAGNFGLKLPNLPGYIPLDKPVYPQINKVDLARENSELFKDVRFGKNIHSGKTPGAQALFNQQKVYNS